jgi:UDP-N-acetylmuramoyl-tripeptide--D-alanyl-D-alanine ligase
LLDAYNANPSSMKAALEMLAGLPAKRKVAILGDMLELGAESMQEHQAILRLCKRKKITDTLVLVGSEFGRADRSQYSNILHFQDAVSARAWFLQQDFKDTMILIKGSRGIRLEQLVNE